ncbi:hypothetical protein BJQ96_01554 [Flavobacterium sp. PL0002]|nr:hypothetical protein [Flavobacterium sp. PL002]
MIFFFCYSKMEGKDVYGEEILVLGVITTLFIKQFNCQFERSRESLF